MRDIYFEKDYGKLFEEIEHGTSEIFEFSHALGSIRHLFIKREIPLQVGGTAYYDLVTPYGYGGPQVMEYVKGRKRDLVAAFETAFRQYCLDNQIVSEFIRFHPVLGNAADFRDCYNALYLRETVGTNLRDFEDPVESEFSKSARKNIRQALKAGVQFNATHHPTDLTEFKRIYYTTMIRNQADQYYYFGDAYFDKLEKLFGENLLLVEAVYEGQVIGAGLNFIYKDMAHTHLSGTLQQYHHLSPAYGLYYALTLWAKDHGVDLIHGGGGRSNSPDDNLLGFKKQFGRNTSFEFWVGRKVWNPAIYEKLCAKAGVDTEAEFFPAYRTIAVKEYNRV